MDLQLNNKVALVTGGSLGIGKAVAIELASEGCMVAIAARRKELLEATASEISGLTGSKVIAIETDTSDPEQITKMIKRTNEELGPIQILVNNAAQVGGGGRNDSLLKGDESLFFDDFNTKMLGYVRAARAVAPYMIDAGWGRIVIVSGMATRQTAGVSGGMRNAAVTNLGSVLAQELGQYGINVNTIQPGGVLTESLEERLKSQNKSSGLKATDLIDQMGQANAIKHLVTAEEIAKVIAFLCSPLSISISGESISVSGGSRAIHY